MTLHLNTSRELDKQLENMFKLIFVVFYNKTFTEMKFYFIFISLRHFSL